MKVRLWQTIALASCVIACAGISFGVVKASIPDSAVTIHCHGPHGQLPVTDTSTGGCAGNETAISRPGLTSGEVTGWQKISCWPSTWNGSQPTGLGGDSNYCSIQNNTIGGIQYNIEVSCPIGKLVVYVSTYTSTSPTGPHADGGGSGEAVLPWVINADGSGAWFEANAYNPTITVICANGSTRPFV
jgi:hypothetical protein